MQIAVKFAFIPQRSWLKFCGMMISVVRLWIWLCALATCAGWMLSAIGQLNRSGYAIIFTLALVVFFFNRKSFGWRFQNRGKVLNRFCRPLPFAFLALAILILLGGTIYPPSNYTGLQYHLARVLQWIAHDGWWWIHSSNYRMNDRATGMEWMMTPMVLFTKSDRALFLINFIPFLLLPATIFGVLSQLGVRRRVAWWWMWLLPTGYGFILQAGSIANDTFPTVFGLAAIYFALKARTSGKVFDVANSILAAALLTGAKASNLPLLLPWAIAMVPILPSFRKRPLTIIAISALATVISFLPNAILNIEFCHDWSGAVLEEPRLAMKNPIVGVYGNFFQFALDNLSPPIFPMAHWWNDHAPLFMPHFLSSAAEKYFDNGFFAVGELPTEDWAGIGCGLTILLAASVFVAFRYRNTQAPFIAATTTPRRLCTLIFATSWLALIAYSTKSGLTNAARIIAPYYPLLVASLVVGAAQSRIVRQRWWKILAGLAVVSSFVILILSPDRPLWPAKTVLQKLVAKHPGSAALTRALNVYTTYSQRSDPLANIRALLPGDIKKVGFIGGADDMDISLWRPFGSRIVEHFFWNDPPKDIRSEVEYAVVGGFNLKGQGMTINDWIQKNDAELVGATNATLKVGEGPQPWYVVRFK